MHLNYFELNDSIHFDSSLTTSKLFDQILKNKSLGTYCILFLNFSYEA